MLKKDMAVDAVRSELLSAKSLLTGNNTENFAPLGSTIRR